MDSLDGEPVSLPCSNEEARIGMPAIVQLHLVNAALETNPHPREDFYRQYSVTPERRTPEGQRTPPPPTYSPGTLLAQEKAFAAGVAETLKQFHAGRVKFRKEEAEQRGIPEESPEYWMSQAKEWQGELWRLIKEMGKRKKQELKGEAEEGYAQAMLLSPVQSPSPPPSNGSLPEDVQHLKTTDTVSDELPEISPQPNAGPMQILLQPTPEHSPDHPPPLRKDQKRKRTESEDHEEKALDQTSRNKRQRRELPTPQQKQSPIPAIESTQGTGKIIAKVDRVEANEEPKPNNLPAPLAKRKLPWKLRSRNAESYRQTGAGATSQIRDHQAPEARVKSRRYGRRNHDRIT